MAWLANLDARASKWPRPAYWLYFALKWYLVAAGAIGLIWWYFDKMRFFSSLTQ